LWKDNTMTGTPAIAGGPLPITVARPLRGSPLGIFPPNCVQIGKEHSFLSGCSFPPLASVLVFIIDAGIADDIELRGEIVHALRGIRERMRATFRHCFEGRA